MVHPIGKMTIMPFCFLWVKRVTGEENIPRPPFIIAMNHASYLDDLLIPSYFIGKLDRRVRIFVNSRYYKNPFLHAFLDHYDCIPVDIAKDVSDNSQRTKTNEEAFRTALRTLRNGDCFGIFPEGSRSLDGKLKKGKNGVARVALASGVKVLPVGIVGSYDILPKGAFFPRFKRAELRIGKPLLFTSKKMDVSAQNKVTKKIMQSIAKLMGQRYPQ